MYKVWAEEMNKRLYSGSIASPRELQAMQADIDMLLRRRSDLEDEELEVMEKREGLDADLAKESAKLQALQTKQQLGIQALSIANQSSSILLGLFR